jgi:hypothetical protein
MHLVTLSREDRMARRLRLKVALAATRFGVAGGVDGARALPA